jgi:hypothetical protein
LAHELTTALRLYNRRLGQREDNERSQLMRTVWQSVRLIRAAIWLKEIHGPSSRKTTVGAPAGVPFGRCCHVQPRRDGGGGAAAAAGLRDDIVIGYFACARWRDSLRATKREP